MGFWGNIGSQIRGLLRFDKEQVVLSLAKGGTSSGYPQTGFDLLQAYGQDILSDYLKLEHDLMGRFVDYEEMDDYPELSSAIDIYADDATQVESLMNKVCWIDSPDKTIQTILEDLLWKRLRIDEEIWEMTRTLVKYGNCVKKGSLVWTASGPKAIETVEEGEFVQSFKDGVPALLRVKKRYANGVKDVYRIQTRHREIFVTEDHQVLVDDGGRHRWVAAKDLKVVRFPSGSINSEKTSKLVISTSAPCSGEVPSWDSLLMGEAVLRQAWGDKGSPNELNLPERITPWFCRLLGFMWGDGFLGNCDPSSSSTQVCYARGAYDDLNDFYDGLFGKLGLSVAVNEDTRQSVVSSVRLKRLLLALGFKNGASEKRIPSWFGTLPREHRMEFLKGFIDADGWTTQQKTWSVPAFHFEIANIDLAKDLKALIDGLGLRSGNLRIRHRKPGFKINGVEVKTTQPTATLTFSYHEYEPGFCSENVLDISKWGEEEVFDIEIDDVAHNFVVDGVVVHNSYEELLVTGDGLVGTNFLPPPTMRRIEGRRGELFGFVQDYKGRFGYSPEEFKQLLSQRASGGNNPQYKYAALEDWEVAHFRLRSKHRRSIYGYSVLEPARWIWKRLMLLEDAAMVYRLQRAPQRYAFYIDVGDMPPKEAMGFLHKMRQQYKKTKFYNPQTGKLDLKFNPLPVSHDTPIPLLDGRTISISEMANEFDQGKKIWVYSIDRGTGHVVPGEVTWVGKTREASSAVKVTFDDGGYAIMAPDHPVMRRDCTYTNAIDLRPGDRVMPLYRRLSDRSKGDSMHDYEMVYDPADKVYRYTHRIVSSELKLHQKGEVIHHKSLDRRNNNPDQLEGMSWAAHQELHKKLGQTGGNAIKKMRLEDKDLHAKLCAASSSNITNYNLSESKRARTSFLNKKYDTARHIRAYNESEKHSADNAIRRKMKTEMWTDEARRRIAQENMKISFPSEFVEGVKALIRENPEISAEGVVRAVNNTVLVRCIASANTRRIKGVHRHMLLKMYRQNGCNSYDEFKQSVLCPTNHRVISVEYVDNCDHYCMTVKDHHNFALSLKDESGNTIFKSGVFVKNSQDEDFFVPVRKGVQATKIDVVQSPSWQHMEDIEYFKLKLYAAIKVPKVYLGSEAPRAKGVLSQEDVRFARTVLRVQREVRNGIKKMCRVHLAALGINPAQADFEVYMTVPSSIFELAQMEVRNAKADLAGRMSQFVSLHWILQKIFGLSDEEIQYIIKERHQEQLADAQIQAKATALGIDAQNAATQRAQAAQQAAAPPEGDEQAQQMAAAQPNTQAAEDLRKHLRGVGTMSHTWPLMRQNLGYRPISERELFHGNRDHEKLVEDNLDKILSSNSGLARRFEELGQLINEIKMSMPNR